jgi:hypothetical protein
MEENCEMICRVFHIISLFNLSFFHNFHVFSNSFHYSTFFYIFHILSLFDLPFFHDKNDHSGVHIGPDGSKKIQENNKVTISVFSCGS